MGGRSGKVGGGVETAIFKAGTWEYIDATRFDAQLVERVVSSNLIATSYCIQEALNLLRLGERPHLVGVASSVAYLPLTRSEAYGASKAGLRYLFRSLRIDLAREGIDVTVVSPGFVDTPLTRKNDFPMPMSWPAPKAARLIAQCLQRNRRPLEIAFPWPLILGLKLLALLPERLQLALGKRMVRDAKQSGSSA